MKKYLLSIVLIGVVLSTHAQINLSQGLVAYYPFNGDVKDYSGNDNHGNISGSPVSVNDRNGNASSAYKFNGNGDHVWVKDHQTLRPADAITVTAWVYCEDFSSWNIVVSKRAVHNGSPWNSYILYAAGTAGSPQNWGFGIATGKTQTNFAVDQSVATTKKWIHLVGIYEKDPSTSGNTTQAAKNVRIYVDCQLVKEEAASGDIYYTDSSLRIGMAIPGSSLQYFKGILDDVRIYNRGLTEQEINALCTGQITQSTDKVIDKEAFQMFPNPARNQVYISGTDVDQITVKVFDNTGKLVLDNKVEHNTIEISALSAGIYYVQLCNPEKNILQFEKLIVQ